MPIRRYIGDGFVFDPETIRAMSEALERSCAALQINDPTPDRESIAMRIINLASIGVVDADTLSDRVIAEMKAQRRPNLAEQPPGFAP